jgi:hypothetical protein
MQPFTALALATAATLLMACAGPERAPLTTAERNELADSIVSTDPLATGEIPPASESRLP